jgi:2'-5' RNA ligase
MGTRSIHGMHRLFVALRPPPEVRALLLATMQGVAGARWQDDAQLHVTVRYIGEVDGAVAEDVATTLSGLHDAPVTWRVSGVGMFESRGRPNALWAGIAPHAPLAALHRKVDQALVRIGLKPEGRAYLPHITLARFGREFAGVDRFLGDHAALSSADVTSGHLTLFESHLGSTGARYEAVARFPLLG